MTWFTSFLIWFNGLDPTSFAAYVLGPPALLVGLVASYFKWRDDHRPQGPHAAE